MRVTGDLRTCDVCGKQGKKFTMSYSGFVRCKSCRNVGKSAYEYDIDLDMFRTVIHKIGDIVEYGAWFKEDDSKHFEI